MRKALIVLFTLIMLTPTIQPLIIITEETPKVFQIADGETMIVIGQDLDAGDIAKNYQQTKQTSNDQHIPPTPARLRNTLPADSSPEPKPQASTTTSTVTRIQTTTSTSSYTVKRSVRHVRMFSSFGGLGHRSDEDQYRQLIHDRNMKWIEDQKKNSRLTFEMKENQFSILTVDQFKQYYLNLVVPSFVPEFKFDLKKEIEKFIGDDDLLKRFFNIDPSWGQINEDFFQFDGQSQQKRKQNQQKKKKDKSIIPVTPSDFNILPDSFDTIPNIIPVSPSNNTPSDNGSRIPDTTPSKNSSDSNSSNDSIVPKNTPIPKNSSTDNYTSPASNNSVVPSSSNSTINPPQNVVPSTSVLDIDWVRQGFVTSIKDQGSCGGCYSFSAQAAIQSAFLLKDPNQYKNIDLSQQQIIDCSGPEGNSGCNGGWMPLSFNYAIKYGTTTESAYPYTETASKCKITGGSFKISSYKGGSLSNCSALSAMVAGRPVSVAVFAGNQYWQNYAGGIMNQCGGGAIDHGVMLVGVYQDASQNYWKVKNSWGTSWGQNGYIRLDRSISNGNICSICSYGFYPEL